MKKILFVFVSILFFAACQSGETSTTTPVATAVDESGMTKKPMAGVNGYEIGTKEDNQQKLKERGTYKDGQRDGAWTTFHTRNGLVETVTNYKNGNRHGAYLKSSKTGTVEEIGYYVNGQLEGPYTKYNRTKVKEELNYKNGQLHGDVVKYFDTGEKLMESNYVNGKRDGVEKYYDEEGNVTLEYTYKNGERQQ